MITSSVVANCLETAGPTPPGAAGLKVRSLVVKEAGDGGGAAVL